MPLTSKGEWRPWQPGDPIRVLVFGRPKAGKTFGAGTFPRTCFFDFDRGLGTLWSPDFIKTHGQRTIQFKSFWERSFKGPIVDAHNAYDDACKYFDEMMTRKDSFDTFVIDSATTLSEDAQNKAVILLGTPEYHNQSQTHAQALKYRMLVPKIQDYGAERSLVEQFVDMVLSTDKHVVILCHEYEKMDKGGELIAIEPLLTGKSRQVVPLKFDEVYHLTANKFGATFDKTMNKTTIVWKRVCQTQPDGLHLCGSRNGVADGTLWTYDAVLKALEASYQERLRLSAVQAAPDKAGAPLAAKTPATAKAV